MQILHLVQNYHPSIGGTQELFKRLSEDFVAHTHDDVTVFTINSTGLPGGHVEPDLPLGTETINGVHVRRFEFWRRPTPVFSKGLRYAKRLGLSGVPLNVLALGPISPSMFGAVARETPDVIACMAFPYLHMYYPLLAPRFGKPRPPVVQFGALHLDDDMRVPPEIVAAVRRADAYIAFTSFERDALVMHGVDPKIVHVIGLGVDATPYLGATGRTIRDRYHLGDRPVVGYIGRHAAYKGADTLLEAMPAVWKKHPDAVAVVAGMRTAFSPRLEELVAALPEDRRRNVVLEFDLPEEEKPAWFAACDIFTTTSRRESYGMSYLEAWACGIPVIGGKIGAVSCVIDHGRDGLLVPCGKADELAAAITTFLDDPAKRKQFGAAGKKKILEQYTWRQVLDRIHAVYESVRR